MKMRYALALAAAVGLGAAAGNLYAAAVKPIYVVLEVDEITDPEGFKTTFQNKDTAAAVQAMVADARYIVRTEKITALDGPAPKSLVIISFQNMRKAQAYNEGMKELTAARLKTTKSRSFIVEGL